MFEVATHPVDAVTWRWLLQVALLSAGLTLAFALAFRGDALSRRSLGVAAGWLLVVVPLLLLIWKPTYQIGVIDPPTLPALAGIPLVVLLVWIGVALIGSLILAVEVIRSTRALRALPGIDDAQTKALCAEFAPALGIKTPQLFAGDRCCASSLGRNSLVVANSFTAWPAAAQRSVIAHEMVHLKRRDDQAMLVLQLVLRWYPFCPWLHSLYQRFVDALEEACDERAAELIGCRKAYLEGLAVAALREGSADRPAPVTVPTVRGSAAALIDPTHKSSFMRRLARLLGAQQFFEVQSGALAAGMGIGLLTLGVLTTFEIVAVSPAYRMVPDTSSTALVFAPGRTGRAPRKDVRNHQAVHEVQVVTRFPADAPRRNEQTTPAIIYPGQALNHNVEGEVLVEYGIANDGSTAAIRVIRTTNSEYFDSTAIRAVKQTVYTPRYNTGLSGVTAADSQGSLLAVRNNRRGDGVSSRARVQKLFLFRIHQPDAVANVSNETQRN